MSVSSIQYLPALIWKQVFTFVFGTIDDREKTDKKLTFNNLAYWKA